MAVIYIVRGLPGSGKSTIARKLVVEQHHREADMFHMVGGEYKFDHTKIKEAHAWCLDEIEDIMIKGGNQIAVSNTFTQRWEYQPYIDAAEKHGYDVAIIECHGPWRNCHSVPEEILVAMEKRWQPHNFNLED